MKAWLTNNTGLKLLSIFVAFFVWLLVINVSNPEVQRSKEIPVEILNEEIMNSAGLAYELVGKNTVTVTYGVRMLDQYRISTSDFKASIDLADFYDVTGVVPVTIEVVNNKDRISAPVATPQVIHVKTEEMQRKRFDLQTTALGTPEEGYALGGITLSPNYVYVKGPVSAVGSISSMGIEVDVDNANSDLSGTAQPIYYDANGNKLNIADERVTLSTTEIQYQLPILKVKNVSLDFEVEGTVADNYRFTGVECDMKSVPVIGLKSDLASFNKITIPGSELNIQGATEDESVTVDLKKYLPENVTIAGEKTEAKIVLKVEELKTRKFVVGTDELIRSGASEQFTYQFDRDTVEITVEGLKEDLDSLAKEDLNATIDLGSMGNGVYKGVIDFRMASGFEVTGYTDFYVTATPKTETAEETESTDKTQETINGTEKETANESAKETEQGAQTE